MSIKQLLENNREWANNEKAEDPEFFRRLANQQSPEYLWIGCSDSRVPANEIIGLRPGMVFVHRNVGNIVVHSDLNCLSVLQYAVDVLKVRHIIVCGHYGCGGISAALSGESQGLIENWLLHIKDVYRANRAEFDTITNLDDKLKRLCELNVSTQALNVASTTIVRHAWQRGQDVTVHALIYSLEDGLLKDLGGSHNPESQPKD